MKKAFVLFAVAAMFVACNKPAQTENEEAAVVDSVVTEVVENDTVEVLDSTLNAVADSVAAEVN